MKQMGYARSGTRSSLTTVSVLVVSVFLAGCALAGPSSDGVVSFRISGTPSRLRSNDLTTSDLGTPFILAGYLINESVLASESGATAAFSALEASIQAAIADARAGGAGTVVLLSPESGFRDSIHGFVALVGAGSGSGSYRAQVPASRTYLAAVETRDTAGDILPDVAWDSVRVAPGSTVTANLRLTDAFIEFGVHLFEQYGFNRPQVLDLDIDVDLGPPSFSVSLGSEQTVYSITEPVSVTATVTDPEGGEDGAAFEYQWFLNGALLEGEAGPSLNVAANAPGREAGLNNIGLIVDRDGQSASGELEFWQFDPQFDEPLQDPPPPQ